MFAKKVVPQLKVMKTAIGLYMNNSNKNIGNYKILKSMFEKYEEVNMIQYVDGNTDKLLFGNKSNDTLSSKLDHLTDNLKNPYIDLYHWIKGELYDIQALTMAIKEKDSNDKALKELEKKNVNTKKDLENV
jgi:hypothetical protein